MFHKPGADGPPDTILPTRNFLLTQADLLTQIRQSLAQSREAPDPRLTLTNGLWWYKDRLFVPPEQRLTVLELCHDHKLAGHFGGRKTAELLSRSFWWPAVDEDCKGYVNACPTCARNKTSRTRAWGLLKPLPIPERPWSQVAMDFIVELPPSAGFSTIFVVVDRLTKMAHFVPMKGTPSAPETAEAFIGNIVRLHGIPSNIVSDRGVQFTSRVWKALCSSLGIELAFSSAYHPQTNGQTERTNQTLEQYLRCFSSFTQDNWSSLLPLAEFAYNNSVHSATNQSPFWANYGYHPTFLPNLLPDNAVPAAQEITEFLEKNSKLLQETLARAQELNKRAYDKGRRGDLDLKLGDRVWLATTNLRLSCPSKKLGPKFIGPFSIKRRINKVAFELDLPPALRIHPVFHISLLKPVTPDSFPNRRMDRPEPVLIDGEEEFEVEAILGQRRRGGITQYLVKWKGYGPEENSWEPEANLHAEELVRAFRRNWSRSELRGGIRRLPLRGGGNVMGCGQWGHPRTFPEPPDLPCTVAQDPEMLLKGHRK